MINQTSYKKKIFGFRNMQEKLEKILFIWLLSAATISPSGGLPLKTNLEATYLAKNLLSSSLWWINVTSTIQNGLLTWLLDFLPGNSDKLFNLCKWNYVFNLF